MRYTARSHEACDNLAAFYHDRIIRGERYAYRHIGPFDKLVQHLSRDRNAGNS